MFKAATVAALLALAASTAVAAPPPPPAPPAPPAPFAPPAPPAPRISHTVFGFGIGGLDEIPASLDWRIDPPGHNTEVPPGSVEFEMGFSRFLNTTSWSRTVPVSDLAGLSEAQLSGPGAQVNFVLRRDAGEFRCHGATSEGKGVGSCTYAANPAFPAAFAKRGVSGPLTAVEQFELAIGDVGFNYLDELKRGGYATPSAPLLIDAIHHGVNLRHLVAYNATGYRFGTLDALIRLRDHGVSDRYLTDLHGYGYANLKADELVQLRDHGVSTSFLKGLHDAGYMSVPVADLARMRDHGVSAEFVGETQKAGFRLRPDDLERLRDHGVTGGFISELRAMGYDRVSAEDIIRLRDHGISVGFIRTSNRDGGHLSPDDLIRLRETGQRP
jgi:hypothetical protein